MFNKAINLGPIDDFVRKTLSDTKNFLHKHLIIVVGVGVPLALASPLVHEFITYNFPKEECSSAVDICVEDIRGKIYYCNAIDGEWKWRSREEYNNACNVNAICSKYEFPEHCLVKGGNPPTNHGKCYSEGWQWDNEQHSVEFYLGSEGIVRACK